MASAASFLHAFVFTFVALASRSCLGFAVSEVEGVAEAVALFICCLAADEAWREVLSLLSFPFGLVLAFSFSLLAFRFSFSFTFSSRLATALGGSSLLASLPEIVLSESSFEVDDLAFLVFDTAGCL